jgi:hypothetical protein
MGNAVLLMRAINRLPNQCLMAAGNVAALGKNKNDW